MRNFKNSVFMSRKNIRLAAFLIYLFSSAAHNRLKNLSTAVNATKHATRILIRPRAKETDATQACHKQGLVTKY